MAWSAITISPGTPLEALVPLRDPAPAREEEAPVLLPVTGNR